MSKMLVVAFDDESKAYEGTKALRELHWDGNVSVYAAAVVARDEDGRLSVKEGADEGPIGTAVGMLTGAMTGLFVGAMAGPGGSAAGAAAGAAAAQGMVLGTAAGAVVGATADLINLGVGTDFVDEVGAQLPPGKTALVAEVDEYWTTPVDYRMEALGGTVYRRWRVDVEDEQIARDIDALKTEYRELKAELHETNEENKAKVQAKIDETKAKLAAAGDRAENKLDSMKAEAKAKAEAIDAQIDKAKEERKAKLEAKKAELKADYERRSDKLKEAWEATKEALAV